MWQQLFLLFFRNQELLHIARALLFWVVLMVLWFPFLEVVDNCPILRALSEGLLAEGDALRQAGKAARGLGEDGGTLWTGDDGVGVREERVDRLAARALDIHVERVGRLDHSLELVGLLLDGRRRVEEIDGESHMCVFV